MSVLDPDACDGSHQGLLVGESLRRRRGQLVDVSEDRLGERVEGVRIEPGLVARASDPAPGSLGADAVGVQERVEGAAGAVLTTAEANVDVAPGQLGALAARGQLEEALEGLAHAGPDVRVDHALVLGHGLGHRGEHLVDEGGDGRRELGCGFAREGLPWSPAEGSRFVHPHEN